MIFVNVDYMKNSLKSKWEILIQLINDTSKRSWLIAGFNSSFTWVYFMIPQYLLSILLHNRLFLALSIHHCVEFLRTVCSLSRLHFNWQSNILRSSVLAQRTRSMLPVHWLPPYDSTGLFTATFISLMHPQPYSFFFCINGSFPHFTYSSLISVRFSPVLCHLEHLGVTFMEFTSVLNWPCDRVLVSALA